jgi:hypothetical protein
VEGVLYFGCIGDSFNCLLGISRNCLRWYVEALLEVPIIMYKAFRNTPPYMSFGGVFKNALYDFSLHQNLRRFLIHLVKPFEAFFRPIEAFQSAFYQCLLGVYIYYP